MDSEREAEVLEAAEAIRNLRGDGDFGAEGFIEVDKADPRNPVVRLRADRLPQGQGGGGGGGGETPKAWTFVPGTGWTYPRLQFGYRLVVGPGEHAPLGVLTFSDEELAQTADGEYYVVCNANDLTFALVRDYAGAMFDYSRGIIAFHVGTVADGVQTFAPHMTPVFYYNV